MVLCYCALQHHSSFSFWGGPGLPSRRPRNFQLLFLSSTLFGFKLRWRRFRRNIENLYRFLVLAITHGGCSQERFGARFVELTSPLRLHIRASQWAGSPRLSDTEPFRPENAFWPRPNDLRQARVGTHRPRDGSSSRLATHGASRAGAEHLSRLWRESGSSASAPAGGGIPDGRPAYRRRSFDSILAPPPRRRASSDAVSSWERGLLVE